MHLIPFDRKMYVDSRLPLDLMDLMLGVGEMGGLVWSWAKVGGEYPRVAVAHLCLAFRLDLDR